MSPPTPCRSIANIVAISIAMAAAIALLGPRPLQAQSLGGGTFATKDNLDLPFDAVGDDDPEEDAPEAVIFYELATESDAVFYVIDSSRSMRDKGELAHAKQI